MVKTKKKKDKEDVIKEMNNEWIVYGDLDEDMLFSLALLYYAYY